jgi:hypothetical protein
MHIARSCEAYAGVSMDFGPADRSLEIDWTPIMHGQRNYQKALEACNCSCEIACELDLFFAEDAKKPFVTKALISFERFATGKRDSFTAFGLCEEGAEKTKAKHAFRPLIAVRRDVQLLRVAFLIRLQEARFLFIRNLSTTAGRTYS